MVHLFSFTDCLARTCRGLCWMALHPQIPGKDPTGQVFSLKAEIARRGRLGSRPTLQRRLKLDTGAAEITAEVQRLFQKHSELEPPNLLQVQTLDHVVYLTGVVDTDLQRLMAESVAGEAPGVTKVINSIGLSGGR